MFSIHHYDKGGVLPTDYKGGTLLAPGMAVTVNASDNFVKATGATCPTHIIVGEKKDGLWGAQRVLESTIYETTATPAVDAVAKDVQIVAGGDGVNNTTGGPFHVTYTDKQAGGVVRGYFKEVHA